MVTGSTRSRDEIYEVQVHFSVGQYILDKFASSFLDYRSLVRLVDIQWAH